MEEKTLLKLSIICTIVGIFLIMFISERVDISESNISDISKKDIDKKIKVKGEVYSVTNTPGLLILGLKDTTGNITIIAFKEEDIELKKGSIIEVYGTIMEYKNMLEIEAELIKLF
ncbi:hypothetical protein HOA59_01610 [archaeon]|mgnify:CR=1 FL=1|jgi:RecJ-like exonuclease|nr:hypothetical protein [archaeon]MBT6824112.1 hypothetical protein [archaeon]MBT7107043.1 hypothetical protein [archaeon]MBT7297655.1 hypothetical protein [archaeon]